MQNDIDILNCSSSLCDEIEYDWYMWYLNNKFYD